MSTQNRSYSTVAVWVLPMLILLRIGPSGNNEAYKSPDHKVPMDWQHYEGNDQQSPEVPQISDIKTLSMQLDDFEREDNKDKNPGKPLYPGFIQTNTQSKSLPAGPETYILKHDNYREFLGPLHMGQMHAAGVGEFEEVLSYDWDGKPSEGESHMLAKDLRKKADAEVPTTKADCTSTTAPSCTKTTAVIRASTNCLPQSSPSSPATTKCPAPPTPKSIQKPSPHCTTSKPTTKKVPIGPKCRKKSKHLSAKTSKMVLEIILATKQHVLSVLKTLDNLEQEVLSRSPDDCPVQNIGRGQSQPKKKPDKQKLKPPKPSLAIHTQAFFGIRHASQMESDADMALAREEELKLKNRVWEEHQQEMRHMPHSKSSRFQRAPLAAIRLERTRELQGPREPLDKRNPLNHHSFDFGATWNAAG